MKGFPNQVAELPKLSKAMQCIVRLVDRGEQAKDDGVLGEDLVRAGVAGTGHTPIPIERYLREQRTKSKSNQSFRTTARGLRELFRLLGFIDDSGPSVVITEAGRHAASFADQPMSNEQLAFWRRTVRNMTHAGGDNAESHPYQVLLRLVARKPGITRANCALALEARDDSQAELDRIGQLANIAVAPGRANAGPAAPPAGAPRAAAVRAPRTSRQVTPDTIGRAATAEDFDEFAATPGFDQAAAAEGIRSRRNRLRRHNLIVQRLAARLAAAGGELYEDPFDVLALIRDIGILGEVKTLDGTEADERERILEALGQLLYYQAFLLPAAAGHASVRAVACFERRISNDHIRFLNHQNIAVIWQDGDGFAGDALAALEELR